MKCNFVTSDTDTTDKTALMENMLQRHLANDLSSTYNNQLTSFLAVHKPEYLEVRCQLGPENRRVQVSCDGTQTALQCDHVLVSIYNTINQNHEPHSRNFLGRSMEDLFS